MKKNTFKIFAAAAALACAGAAAAQDFGLGNVNTAEIRAADAYAAPAAPDAETGARYGLGLDATVRVPFRMMKNLLMNLSGKGVTVLDKNAAVVYKAGESVKIGNLNVDIGGIIVQPVATARVYYVSRNKVAVRIERIKFHMAMEPSVKSLPEFSQEEIMDKLMVTVIKSVNDALAGMLAKKKLALKPEDVVKLTYDKATWTLYAKMSSTLARQFAPEALEGDVNLTGLTVTDAGVSVRLQTSAQ